MTLLFQILGFIFFLFVLVIAVIISALVMILKQFDKWYKDRR
jgi:hypothetical protein